ncbi:cytochrome P450 family protein [Fodinicola feengrottensis]|uniref:hypothetical protein n=1 Tax=Fodinicola feengrottensis TaxID=435914 RepID=UPI0024414D57|nr:hypothetical protein [Fodinicola feengrottensis]
MWAEQTNDWAVATGYAACGQVLRSPDFGVDDRAEFDRSDPNWRESPVLRRAANSLLHFMNSPDHERVRRLVAGTFTPRRIGDMRVAIETAASRLIDRLAERGADGAPVDFISGFAFELPITVICDLVGVSPADRHWFHQRVNAIVAAPRAHRCAPDAPCWSPTTSRGRSLPWIRQQWSCGTISPRWWPNAASHRSRISPAHWPPHTTRRAQSAKRSCWRAWHW